MKRINKIQYRLIKTTEYVEDSGAVAAYGICCREEEKMPNRKRVKFHVVPNISTKPAFVEELIAMLINYEADPIHIMDLIQDYLP